VQSGSHTAGDHGHWWLSLQCGQLTSETNVTVAGLTWWAVFQLNIAPLGTARYIPAFKLQLDIFLRQPGVQINLGTQDIQHGCIPVPRQESVITLKISTLLLSF
jgi:hypothetical protein